MKWCEFLRMFIVCGCKLWITWKISKTIKNKQIELNFLFFSFFIYLETHNQSILIQCHSILFSIFVYTLNILKKPNIFLWTENQNKKSSKSIIELCMLLDRLSGVSKQIEIQSFFYLASQYICIKLSNIEVWPLRHTSLLILHLSPTFTDLCNTPTWSNVFFFIWYSFSFIFSNCMVNIEFACYTSVQKKCLFGFRQVLCRR